MKTIYSLIEDCEGKIVGAMLGTDPEALETLNLQTEDICPRSELPAKASDLCRKYGLQPSPKMAQALSRALTPPVPDGA